MRNALGAVESVLVLGATSEIGRAIAKRLAEDRARRFVLAARDPSRIDTSELNGAETTAKPFDAAKPGTHAAFADEVFDQHGDIDLALIAFGVLGDQDKAATDARTAVELIEANYTGVVSISIELVRRMKQQGHGTLVFLSSVAAERPRKSNFVYGSSKAAMDAFAQGLGDSLQGSGVDVLVVRPGFVRTKMTEGMDEAPFTVEPDAVADAVVDGLRRKTHTVWAPPILRVVMSILRHLPRPVFRRLPM